MDEYNYLNGLKVGDKQYFKNLDVAIEDIWGKNDDSMKPHIRILDDYDYIESHPDVDKTDEIEFYLYFPTNTIYMTDLISFAEIIEVYIELMTIYTSDDGKLILYWKEKVIYQDLIETQHVDTTELVSIGNKFIQEIKSLKNDGKPVNLEPTEKVRNVKWVNS